LECVLILRIAQREGGDSVLAGSPMPRAKIGSWQIKIALKREARGEGERCLISLLFTFFSAVLLLQGVTCRKISLCLRRERGRSSKIEKREIHYCWLVEWPVNMYTRYFNLTSNYLLKSCGLLAMRCSVGYTVFTKQYQGTLT